MAHGTGEPARPETVAVWRMNEWGEAEELDSYTNWD